MGRVGWRGLCTPTLRAGARPPPWPGLRRASPARYALPAQNWHLALTCSPLGRGPEITAVLAPRAWDPGRFPGEEYPVNHRCLESPGLCCSASSPPLTAGGRPPDLSAQDSVTPAALTTAPRLESPGVCKSQTVAEALGQGETRQHCSGRRDREIQGLSTWCTPLLAGCASDLL